MDRLYRLSDEEVIDISRGVCFQPEVVCVETDDCGECIRKFLASRIVMSYGEVENGKEEKN